MPLGKKVLKPKKYRKHLIKKKAPTNLAQRVLRLEKKTRDSTVCEYMKNDFFRDLRTLTGNVYTVLLNEPNSCTFPFDTNITPANTKVDQIYQANMGFRITFSAERTNIVASTYITYFIVRAKAALTPTLVSGVLQPVFNTHYTTASDGLVSQGISPCPLVNKDLFQIIAFRRFFMGNQVFVGQGPTVLKDTHREFYHKIPMKVTTRDTKDNAFTNTETDMNVRERFYLMVITDKEVNLAPVNQPPIYINGQCLIKSYFSPK